MVKRFLILLAACSLLMFPIVAYADIIWEPPVILEPPDPGNYFYSQHKNECVPMNRSFYANGEGGSVSVKIAPDSETEIGVIENNSECYIKYTYDYEGELWGLVDLKLALDQTSDTARPEEGWVPMNQLLD